LNPRRCWRTLQQRVKPVSSWVYRSWIAVLLASVSVQVVHGQNVKVSRSQENAPKPSGGVPAQADPQQLFLEGQSALQKGNLDEAEKAFRAVLALNPQVAGAYANLGVVYMRRKQWSRALEMLHKAEHLAPQVAGVRLNIGLVHYRQNDFRGAIAPFESVVRDVPDAYQAGYLLGLCYFFVARDADAVRVLEPLWPQASTQLNYLYVLGIAGGRAGRADLEQRALGRLVEIGGDSAEFHLLTGKAHLNHEEYDEAIAELELAAKADAKLPFVHFYLGQAYLKKQDLERARDEFQRDLALEPDVVYDYDQLGQIDCLQERDLEAEKMFHKALRLDPRLSSSHFQLARVYQREGKYALALTEVDATIKLSPESEGAHYVRGQILQRLGRTPEAKAEMQKFTEMSNQAREKRHEEIEGEPVPDPALTREPQ